jgi:hypothetical protein
LSRRGLGAAAASAVIALSFAPLFAPPADAQAQQNGPTVTMSPLTVTPAPGVGGAITMPNLTVAGHAHADGVQPQIDWLSVSLLWDKGPPPGPAVPGPFTYCGKPPSGPPGPPCTGNDFDFTVNMDMTHASNGPYKATATAHAVDVVGPDGTGSSPQAAFKLAVPPPPATAVVAVADKNSRETTVSWDRDASTPDVQSYWIYRKGPGDADFKAVLQTPQLSKGARVTIIDTGTQYAGGDYVYQVETRRNGASGDGSTYVPSDRTKSQSNKVTVAEPPPGTPTTEPPPPTKGNAAPPVVRGTPSGVSRNSGFSGSGSSSAATTPTSEPVTPDPGFVRGLPYAGQQPGAEGEGDNSAVAVTPGTHKSNRRGLLVPVATGAILFVGAFHLRILKKRLDEPPALA